MQMMATANVNEVIPQGEFSVDQDEFGTIVRVNVEKLRDLSRVPGIKAVYPTEPDPDQPNRHHAIISNMKDLNGDGRIHVFRALIDKPYTRIACYNPEGERVWISEKIAAGGDDESGMPVVDIDGDGRYEILLSQWASLYCLDAHTGQIKWQRDLDKGGQAGPGNWDCPMVVGHFIDRERLSIVVRSGLNLRCFDGAGQEIWHAPLTGETYGHCLCRFDVDGDGVDEVFSARNHMIDVFSGNGTVLWRDATQGNHSDNFAFGDLDGDGRCEVVYDHDGCEGGKGPLYVADAATGDLKYTIDYQCHGLGHCQGFVMDKFCPDRPGLQIAVVGKDHRLLLFDCRGELLWERRTYSGLVTRADWNGDGVPEILVFAVGTDLDPAWSVWNGKGERLFAMSFLPAPQRCHASQCGPGLGVDGFTDLDGNGKADILVAYGRWKTGDPQYHFIAEDCKTLSRET